MGKFKCEMCGGVFDREWTDEVADREAEEVWGVKDASGREDMAMVCDDCFKKLLASADSDPSAESPERN